MTQRTPFKRTFVAGNLLASISLLLVTGSLSTASAKPFGAHCDPLPAYPTVNGKIYVSGIYATAGDCSQARTVVHVFEQHIASTNCVEHFRGPRYCQVRLGRQQWNCWLQGGHSTSATCLHSPRTKIYFRMWSQPT